MNDGIGNTSENHRLEAIAHCAKALRFLLVFGKRELGRSCESDCVRDVLGSGPATTILRASVHQRLDLGSAANEQRTDALGRADLVTGDRQQVELLIRGVDVNLSERLHA